MCVFVYICMHVSVRVCVCVCVYVCTNIRETNARPPLHDRTPAQYTRTIVFVSQGDGFFKKKGVGGGGVEGPGSLDHYVY